MDFIIINDVRQKMSSNLPNGPWIHHATIRRGFKEYIIFRHSPSGKIYLEEVEQQRATLILKQIEDINEWKDLYAFSLAAGILQVLGPEVKVADAKS